MRAAAGLLALLCAGCLANNPSPEDEGGGTSIPVAPGEWRLLRPIGSRDFAIDLDGSYSATAGTWTLAVDRVGMLAGSWKLTASVFDASVEWPCDETWRRSDLDLTGET